MISRETHFPGVSEQVAKSFGICEGISQEELPSLCNEQQLKNRNLNSKREFKFTCKYIL